jgi:predicted thioredoxin/glutaredoxin
MYVTAAVVYLMLSAAIGRVGLRMERRAAAYRSPRWAKDAKKAVKSD